MTDKSDARERALEMARIAAASIRPRSAWAKRVLAGHRDDDDAVLAALAALKATPLPEAVPATDLERGAKDLPTRFEAWWATYPHNGRVLANYGQKKQIAFDAFEAASRDAARWADGFVLVPRKPTEEMLDALARQAQKPTGWHNVYPAMYRALLAAAPTPQPSPASAGEREVLTNGQQYEQDYTPGADKAREIVSWIDSGETRNRVYRMVRDALNEAVLTPDAGQGVDFEGLGDALFALSAAMKSSGFLNDPMHHARYERVVAEFQKLSPASPDGQEGGA